MTEVTCILNQIEDGDPTAASQLLPLVYDDLKRFAAYKMANERPGQIVSGSLDNTIKVWNANNGEENPRSRVGLAA